MRHNSHYYDAQNLYVREQNEQIKRDHRLDSCDIFGNTMNGHSYLDVLNYYVLPHLTVEGTSSIGFWQVGGASAHYANKRLLNNNLSGRWNLFPASSFTAHVISVDVMFNEFGCALLFTRT